MGNYRIVIDAVGAHGCDRGAQPGKPLYARCGRMGCPDCEADALVRRLQSSGSQVNAATFTHWPDTPNTVVDNLLTRERVSGVFT